MLFRLIYHSENHLGVADGRMIPDLNAIMDASNRNNEKAGVTGALIFDSLWFLQILEGEREAVAATLRRIAQDSRHDNVTVMDARAVEERLFGKWWMGLAFMRGDNSALYARHGLGERLDPRRMSGEQALALALDLQQRGLNRTAEAKAA
jgi:hypothetical protein